METASPRLTRADAAGYGIRDTGVAAQTMHAGAMVRHEYSTDVEGGAPVQVRYAIMGRIDPATYLPFVLNRARWLDINGWASAEEGTATVVASGPEALVGALEMACTLGPWDALVETIDAKDEPGDVEVGFEIRSRESSPASIGGEGDRPKGGGGGGHKH
jgi:acylphosphatase